MRNNKGQFVKGSSGFTGRHTEETKTKIRKARARQGSNVWNKGLEGYSNKPHTEETKDKIGVAQLGEKNHAWKGGKSRCLDCDRQLNHWRGGRCRSCSGKKRQGSEHWNWTDGKSHEPYPYYFRESLKNSIRELYEFTCQGCGGWGNSIHHIDYNKQNCSSNNLINVCKSCNTKANYGREKWQKFYQSKVIKT